MIKAPKVQVDLVPLWQIWLSIYLFFQFFYYKMWSLLYQTVTFVPDDKIVQVVLVRRNLKGESNQTQHPSFSAYLYRFQYIALSLV